MSDRRVTAADVAAAAGVSRATVGFVLNATPGQTISAAVSERVEREARRLGYRPHPHARALARGSSRIVLVPLPEWPVAYALGQILDEASAALDDAGYTLVTTDPYRSGRARPLWDTLQPDVVMPIEPLDAADSAAIAALGIRLVDPVSPRSEEAAAVDLQIGHLIENGHRSLAFASTTVAGLARMNEARLRRARELCAQAGVGLRVGAIDDATVRTLVRSWTGDGVTAVVAFNDDTAAAVLGAAVRQGLRVPGDLAVIGHDDAPLARLVVPSLTTIRFDFTGLGKHVARVALAAAAGTAAPADRPSPIRARVVQREST